MTLGLVTGITACGEDGGELEVLHPPAGATVEVPFEVTVDAGVPLGSPDDGLHHLHIWFGDRIDTYLVVESPTVEITSAPAGEQELHFSLREPDHTSAGAEASVPLIISPGAG